MIIIPERRHPKYPEEPVPIDDPYLPEDPGDEPDEWGNGFMVFRIFIVFTLLLYLKLYLLPMEVLLNPYLKPTSLMIPNSSPDYMNSLNGYLTIYTIL